MLDFCSQSQKALQTFVSSQFSFETFPISNCFFFKKHKMTKTDLISYDLMWSHMRLGYLIWGYFSLIWGYFTLIWGKVSSYDIIWDHMRVLCFWWFLEIYFSYVFFYIFCVCLQKTFQFGGGGLEKWRARTAISKKNKGTASTVASSTQNLMQELFWFELDPAKGKGKLFSAGTASTWIGPPKKEKCLVQEILQLEFVSPKRNMFSEEMLQLELVPPKRKMFNEEMLQLELAPQKEKCLVQEMLQLEFVSPKRNIFSEEMLQLELVPPKRKMFNEEMLQLELAPPKENMFSEEMLQLGLVPPKRKHI